MSRLPPLTALRVLEAIGATGSVTAAAGRLNVSHSAVSFQIRILEEWSSVPLFVRRGRSTRLTEAGASLARVTQGAFDSIRHEMDRLPLRSIRSVSISALPVFAAEWLMPRLAEFLGAHPDLRVHLGLAHSDRPASPTPDLMILFGHRGRLRAGDRPLIQGQAAPVCAPSLLHAFAGDATRLLETGTLVQEEDMRMWDAWFQKSGIARSVPGSDVRLVVEDSSLLRAAALKGLGVVLCRTAFIAQSVARGELALLSDIAIDEDYVYFVRPAANAVENAEVARLLDWLSEAAERDADPPVPGS